MEIIKIYQGNVVSAKELHGFLEIKTIYANWVKRNLLTDFEEGKDFFPKMEKSTGGRQRKEYLLTLATAKKLAMMARTPRGEQAREYFIQCEAVLQELANNKRLEAFRKLNTTKDRFKNVLLNIGLAEQDYIEIDTAGRKVFMNGQIIDDGLLQTVLLTARDLATQMTHYHTTQNSLKETDEIRGSNEENHIAVRNTLLDKGIVPENLPQQEDIKKLQNGGDEGEQES